MLGTRRKRDLRTRKERVDAHEVDDHATLDLLDERAFDRLVGLVRLTDPLPDAHEIGFLLRKHDGAFLILEMLEQHLDLVTWLEVGMILELFERNGALGLEADVEDDHVVPDFQDLALDDLTFVDRRECSRVQLDHLRFLLGRILVLIPPVVAVGEEAQLSLLLVAL